MYVFMDVNHLYQNFSVQSATSLLLGVIIILICWPVANKAAITKLVLKVLWSLDQWLGPTFPMDLVFIHAYLGCIQVCSGFPSSTLMFQSYGI